MELNDNGLLGPRMNFSQASVNTERNEVQSSIHEEAGTVKFCKDAAYCIKHSPIFLQNLQKLKTHRSEKFV